MFSNIGKKIKILAKVICWLGIIASVIYAISIWAIGGQVREAATWSSSYYYNGMPIYETGRSASPSTFLPGLIVLVVGCLLSWVGSFCLYGFGELIDRAKSIDAALEDLHAALSERSDDTPRPAPVKEPEVTVTTEPKPETPPQEEILPEEDPEPAEQEETEAEETKPAEEPLPEPEVKEAEEEIPAETETEQPVPEEPEPESKEEPEPEPAADTESGKQKAIEELIRKIASGEISLDAYGWALNDENRRYVHCPGCGKKYSSVYMRGQEACPGCGYPHVKQSGNN